MKSVGLTGPPGSGKTTLWRAITGGRASGNSAVVDVVDPRVDRLAEIHRSERRVYPRFEFVDVHAGARTDAETVAHLRECDVVLLVLPAFAGIDPEAAFTELVEELLLADLGLIETRLSRARKDPAAAREVETLEKAVAALEEGSLLKAKEWEAPDREVFAGLAPVTLKPMLAAVNVDEARLDEPPPSLEDLPVIKICAQLEAEAGDLDPSEAASLLGEYGIAALASRRIPQEVASLLDLVVFFTTEPKETRAWQIPQGATCLDAAGNIHTDMRRGFIRAEVCPYEEVIEAGGWEPAKSKNLVRVEGKEYQVQDGDVLRIRFSI